MAPVVTIVLQDIGLDN